MNDREKSIVMAYTGVCMLAGDKLGLFYQYVQDKLGWCVMTHELAYPEVQDAIREATKNDFIELCRASDEPRVMTLEEVRDEAEYMYLEKHSVTGSDLYGCAIRGDWDAFGIELIMSEYDTARERWSDYGKTWRCWTARPTDAQREAIPWGT